MSNPYRHESDAEWVDTVEVAKLIRKALKHDFPGVKFSVRSSRYAGGSSVDISYTDGPSPKGVRKVAESYDGKRFDGMIDLAYTVRHVLYPDADGILRAMLVANPGTESSKGSDPAKYVHPEDVPEGARPVRFSAGYISVRRDFTPEAFRAAAAFVVTRKAFEGYVPEYDDKGRLKNAPREDHGYRRDANQLARSALSSVDLTGCTTPQEIARAVWMQTDSDNAHPSGIVAAAVSRAVSDAHNTYCASLHEQAATEMETYRAPVVDITQPMHDGALTTARAAAYRAFCRRWSELVKEAGGAGVEIAAVGPERVAAWDEANERLETQCNEERATATNAYRLQQADNERKAERAADEAAHGADLAAPLSLRKVDSDAVRTSAHFACKVTTLEQVEEETARLTADEREPVPTVAPQPAPTAGAWTWVTTTT